MTLPPFPFLPASPEERLRLTQYGELVRAMALEWVSVDERLPPNGGYWLVTVATDDGPEVHSLLFLANKKQWMHEGEATFEHSYHFRPTHWAPLPLPAAIDAASSGGKGDGEAR